MPVNALQHINIRCADVEKARDFYTLLGLTVGDRPPFASQGYWLYVGDVPIVHLVQKKPEEKQLGPGTGELDHIALGGEDLDAMRATLKSHGIAFREAIVPRDNTVQVFVTDPDGIQLELNFLMS
jgi:catechol 2,3-dioxygenase-like lactoylglutathione lyase family enzyme